MQFFVYILKCHDGTYYVGSTNNLERRLHEHNFAKKGAHYTKIRRPVELLYSEILPSLGEARSREYILKTYTRKQKEDLIASVSGRVTVVEREKKAV